MRSLRGPMVALVLSLGPTFFVNAGQGGPHLPAPLAEGGVLASSPLWQTPWVLGPLVLLVAAVLAVLFHRFKCARCVHLHQQRAAQVTVDVAQRRLAAILEHTSDLVAFADAERRPLYMNAAGREMLGLKPDEDLSAFEAHQMYPPWANDLILREGLPTALREGVWRGQCAVRRRDGREIPVSQVITSHRRPNGTLEFTSTIIRDIASQVDTLRALESSEAKFRSYWEACPMGIHAYELQPDDRLVFVDGNPAADRILGVDCQQFVGRTLEEAFPPLANSSLAAAYRRAAREGVPYHSEQVEYEHGPIRGVFEVYAFQPGPNRVAAMFVEITVQKQAELALRESEERFQQLAHSIQEVFYLVEWPDPHFIYVSPAFESIWGGQTSDLYHDPTLWSALIHPKDRTRVEASRQEQVPTGEWTTIYRLVRPDGSLRWIRDRAFAIRDASGQVYRLAGAAEDITERQQAETAEQTFRRLAQSLVGSLFLHDLGHYVAAACRTLFQQDAFFLELIDPESGARTPVYAEDTRSGSDTPEEVEAPTLALTPDWLCRLQRGHTLILHQSPDTEQPGLGPWGFHERRTRSILLSPVVSGGRCIGLVSLQSYTPNRYESRDADLLQTLANQCAGTLLRVQAEEQLRQLNSELEAKIRDRTNELQRVVNLMAGRETRMSELKQEIRRLRQELHRAQSRPQPTPASGPLPPPPPPTAS